MVTEKLVSNWCRNRVVWEISVNVVLKSYSCTKSIINYLSLWYQMTMLSKWLSLPFAAMTTSVPNSERKCSSSISKRWLQSLPMWLNDAMSSMLWGCLEAHIHWISKHNLLVWASGVHYAGRIFLLSIDLTENYVLLCNNLCYALSLLVKPGSRHWITI